jgi:hypothetical protein
MAYAATTKVPIDRSKRHIEELLMRAGAEGYHTGWQAASGDDPGWDAIEFLWKGRHIRFRLPRQAPAPPRSRNKRTTPEQRDRQRWRVLYLVVKAKIEAVEAGIAVFEEEFLSFIVTASGKTVGEVLLPRLATGKGPLQLESGGGA